MASRHPHSDSTLRPEVMNIAVATAQDLIASASLFDRCLRLYLCIQCEDGWKRMVSGMRMVQTPPPLRSFRRHATHVDGTLDPARLCNCAIVLANATSALCCSAHSVLSVYGRDSVPSVCPRQCRIRTEKIGGIVLVLSMTSTPAFINPHA